MRGLTRFISPLGAAIAALLVLAYVVVVLHFAVNIPASDEWTYTVPLVDAALHGHATLGLLWQPWSDGHWFLPNLAILVVGLYDHLNIRALIALSALLRVASFVLVLALARPMLGRRVRAGEVLLLGVAFFSLGDIDKALWGLGLPVYLVMFFAIAAYLFLHLAMTRAPSRRWMILAIAAAALASLSSIQGLLVWPTGFIALAWSDPRAKDALRRLLSWLVATVVVGAVCLIDSAGPQIDSRSPLYSLSHPIGAGGYGLVLTGSLSSSLTANLWSGHELQLGLRQLIGLLVIVLSIVVVVAQFRWSRRQPASWLPAVLITFGLSWDLLVAAGRLSRGIETAVQSSYQTPQVFVAVGLVLGAVSMIQHLWRQRPERRTWIAIGATVFVVALGSQLVVSDIIGLQNGTWSRSDRTTAARDVVNLNEIPAAKRYCYMNRLLLKDLGTRGEVEFYIEGWIPMTRRDHLSLFAPEPLADWQARGPGGIYFC